jgi:hypothetical protein
MNTNRRDFLRIAGAAGAGMVTAGMVSCNEPAPFSETLKAVKRSHRQHFNMSGYGAPPINNVRIGIIGIGRRGIGAVHRLKLIEGCEIKAICDLRMECVEAGQKAITDFGLPAARIYGGKEDSWKEMCLSPDLDLIYIVTPWNLHTPMSVFAMENGKHAVVEVPAAMTIDECWQLVETSEKTKKHCMMLENCCYDFFELLTLNMTRQGFFGELTHAEGAYIHSYGPSVQPRKYEYADKWRIEQVQGLKGNYYPTHGLGPLCQALNINRGDKFTFMSSMSCHDFVLGKKYTELAKTDEYFKQFDPGNQHGSTNTSLIMTEKGKTIMLQQGGPTPRVYSRIHLLSGTKGSALKYPLPGRISSGVAWMTPEQMNELTEKYTPEIVKRVGEMAKKVGGHGGMDFMMDWRLIDCLRNGLPLDQDVYDAALWSAVVPLSSWSVSNNSNSIAVPDFTCGSYIENVPVDINLLKGGNTGVRLIKDDEKEKQLSV